MGGDKSETSIKHILIEVRSFLIVSNPTIMDFTMLRNYKIFQRTKKKCNNYEDQCFFKLTVLRSDSMKRNYGRFIFMSLTKKFCNVLTSLRCLNVTKFRQGCNTDLHIISLFLVNFITPYLMG